MYRTECTMFNEVSMGNPGKVPYCNERDQFEPDCTNCERPNVTNADKIRAMADEELASFLYDTDNLSSWCIGRHGETDCPDGGCLMCWENWLKQEAE